MLYPYRYRYISCTSCRPLLRQKTLDEKVAPSGPLHGGEWSPQSFGRNILSLWCAKAAPRWGGGESGAVESPSNNSQPPLSATTYSSEFGFSRARLYLT